MKKVKLIQGDCLQKMKEMPDNSVDSVVCDPPYGLSFMGKKWDYDVPKVEIWQECLRVLKPGGHLLAFAGTRTQHRMAVNIEDAGFEIRDIIAWVYGSGFPKSLNIGKAVDKIQGNERELLGIDERYNEPSGIVNIGQGKRNKIQRKVTKGNSPYEGQGTALKPAIEPITVARKPISEKNIAENVLKWGTGGINIDDSRVGTEQITTNDRGSMSGSTPIVPQSEDFKGETHTGRWPANFIHDGSQEVLNLFPNGGEKSESRFFYCAKASKSERNAGLDGVELKENSGSYQFRADGSLDGKPKQPKANFHPTVKPIKLMEYLVCLVTPSGGVCLDPFMGSGTTGVACKNLNRNFIGIELDQEYFKLAEKRIP